jgi:hypothetical protein
MKSVALAVFLLVLCSLPFLAQAAPQTSSSGPAIARTMYETVELVGTLLSSAVMYGPGEKTAWLTGDLRIDTGTKDYPQGARVALHFPISPNQPKLIPSVGDQIKATAHPDRGTVLAYQATTIPMLRAEKTPVIIGRGEILRPGEGAAFDSGPADAKVLVKMYAPLQTECHAKTAKLLKELAAREPVRVRVQIFDMSSVAARADMKREQLGCATVLVNNRTDFILDIPGGKRKVTLSHRPNINKPTYYSEDVINVVEQELKGFYPAK